jgi:hypothetical protein
MDGLNHIVAPALEVGSGIRLVEAERHWEVGTSRKAGSDKAMNEDSMANQMKDVRKQRLRRMVMQDPSLAKRLVAAEASPVYNAKGELIQSLGSGSEF